jgi:hypothetical protein
MPRYFPHSSAEGVNDFDADVGDSEVHVQFWNRCSGSYHFDGLQAPWMPKLRARFWMWTNFIKPSLGFDAGPLSIGEFQTPLYSNLWSISRYVAFPSFICPLSLRLGRILLNTDSIAKAMAFRRWNRPKLSAKRQLHILAHQQDSGPALATLYPLITALED